MLIVGSVIPGKSVSVPKDRVDLVLSINKPEMPGTLPSLNQQAVWLMLLVKRVTRSLLYGWSGLVLVT